MTYRRHKTRFGGVGWSVPAWRVFLVVAALAAGWLASDGARIAYASAPDPGTAVYAAKPQVEQPSAPEDEGCEAASEATDAEDSLSASSSDDQATDGEWVVQLGAWHAQHDEEAAKAAREASRDIQAERERAAPEKQLPALADRLPVALECAVGSLGGALALLAVGRRFRSDATPRTPVPTKRRSTR